MNFKIIFLLFTLATFLTASIQEVRVGIIDSYYDDKITKTELKQIINEIEDIFETQLGFDVFNYTNTGKPIDIIFIASDKLEKKIAKKILLLDSKKEKILELRRFLPDKLHRIELYQKTLKKFSIHINTLTKQINNYVHKANKEKNLTSTEYKNAQLYVNKKQKRINRDVINLRKERRKLRKMLDSYNKNIYRANTAVKEHNRLINQITRMSRNIKIVKGRTFGLKETTLKTYYKEDRKIKEKSEHTSMTKIEIYGFESKQQLKAVLAHEIGHLLGIPHINTKNALMNPILQKNQINSLFLIEADIRNFKKNF